MKTLRKIVPKLKMQYKDVVGAYNSGGQSMNIWGQVPFPLEILELADYAKLIKKRKSCVWTAYDNEIYDKNFQRGEITREMLESAVRDMLSFKMRVHDNVFLFELVKYAEKYGVESVLKNEYYIEKVKDILELKIRGIPSTISATFKSGFKNYTAIAENIGMHIAIILDIPTSYNYIVAFDKEEHPDIVNNYKGYNKSENVQSLGIVSIDFLQNKIVPLYQSEFLNREGEWVSDDKDYCEDELIPFDDYLTTNDGKLQNDERNLVKNWIIGVRKNAEIFMDDFTEEEKTRYIRNIESRIVRSFLLRELLGDCDFTAYNGGIVLNRKKHKLKYAPNFDYGECLNMLIRKRLDVNSNTNNVPQSVLDNLPENVREALSKSSNNKKLPVEEIAQMYSNSTSEENLKFILENYQYGTKEFFDNLSNAIRTNAFDSVMEWYTQTYHNGEPLLTQNEAEDIKNFLRFRSEWMISMYNEKNLRSEDLNEKSV